MARQRKIYTYRNGQKVELEKRPDQFIVRALPAELHAAEFPVAEQTSSASTRVECTSNNIEEMMSEARELAVTHHAYTEAETGTDFLITDRIIVTFEEAPSPVELGEFAGKYGLQILVPFSSTKYMFRLTDQTGMNPVKLVVELVEKEKKLLASVEHDLNHTISKSQLDPTDPFYVEQWHLHQRRTEDADYDRRSSARCEQAWGLLGNHGSADVVVGVTDDGCQLDHPDFSGEGKFPGWGYFEGFTLNTLGMVGADPELMYEAGANHGTSCAGVIGAELDGVMTVGAAPNCRLVPIKWESDGPSLFISDSKLLIALNYLAARVDIISNSWGGAPHNNWSSDVLDRIRELAQTGGRRGKGILFLWAAGNENCPISHTSQFDIPFTSGVRFDPIREVLVWIGVETSKTFSNNLVGVPGSMQIAALASTAQRSHYSNYGTGISLTAPSSNSHTYHRLNLPGLGITTATGSAPQVTGRFGGTSSATPLVAGVAALVLSVNTDLTAIELVDLLQETASQDLNFEGWPKTPPHSVDPDPTASWDVSPVAPFDAGDFRNDGTGGQWSPWFGYGRVDAEEAVRRAQGVVVTRHVRVEKDEALDIPDDNPIGVASRVFAQQAGRIDSLAVEVDIAHTYIGDLIVRLIGPEGQVAVLHSRSGGRTRNLKRTFDAANTPSLAQFTGAEMRGAWTLEVSDHAAIDEGRLNRWALDARVFGANKLEVESTPALAIPDADPAGIADEMTVGDAFALGRVAVDVDITHTWIGDLRVTLTSPSGTDVVLHDQAGGRADNILKRYTSAEVASLANLAGEPVTGNWRLHVSDNVGQDEGKLNRWKLTLE